MSCEHKGSPTRRLVKAELVDLGAAALDQNNQHDGEQNAGYDTDESNAVHLRSSFHLLLNKDLNDSIMMMAAGPRVTRNSEGKMKSTSGKISLMVVLAAISSTC